jgi:hypothetical protein
MNTQTKEALKMAKDFIKEKMDEEQEMYGDDVQIPFNKMIVAIEKALEQPAQEPVGYTAPWCIEYVAEYHIHEHTPTAEFWYKKGSSNEVPLYIHPAQPWQELTDDDFHEADGIEFRRGAAWAEQMLYEKNNHLSQPLGDITS